jgi:hypothetical protein
MPISMADPTMRSSMFDLQSQAHSTNQSPFNGRFKKTLRLNRDHGRYQSLPEYDGVPRKYQKNRLSYQNKKL